MKKRLKTKNWLFSNELHKQLTLFTLGLALLFLVVSFLNGSFIFEKIPVGKVLSYETTTRTVSSTSTSTSSSSIITPTIIDQRIIDGNIDNKLVPGNFVYVFTLNTKTWEITKAMVYEQSDLAEELVANYTTKQNKYLDKKMRLEFVYLRQIVKVPFSAYTTKITEEFTETEIKLIENKEVLLNEVEVRVPFEQFLLNKSFTLRVVDNFGVVKSKKVYSINEGTIRSNTDSITGKIVLDPNKIYYLASGGVTIVKLFLPQPCSDLKQVIPNHNNINENRINIVFQGVSYDRDSLGKPDFVKYLPFLLDINGIGTDWYTNKKAYGLFGERPFIGNSKIFNFWYSDDILSIDIDNYGKCSGFISPLPDQSGVETVCKLPNKQSVYLLNCGSTSAATPGSMTLFFHFHDPFESLDPAIANDFASHIRIFIHEIWHMLGNLADEYETYPLVDVPRYPNCAADESTAETWGYSGTYAGCSYTPSNYRPSELSVMRAHKDTIDEEGFHIGDNDFDRINEEHLCFKMREMTGMDFYCPIKSIRREEDILIRK